MSAIDALNLFIPPVTEPNECWEWTGRRTSQGYGQFKFGGREVRAHRLMYAVIHGDPGPHLVRHTCDNPPCVNPAHLLSGTHADNARDRVTRNRGADTTGENNPRAKLTWATVISIRKRMEDGESNKSIIQSTGIDKSIVSQIRHNKIWKQP